MPRKDKDKRGRAVPSRRLTRLAGLGGVAANVAGSVAAGGVKTLASGKRPKLSSLLLTPANARKITRQLSTMRGAAMKLGQMISMDTGDFLPKELADILARLRADAQHMPHKQLEQVLLEEWGPAWERKFAEFEYHPIAAASIGQVHKAALPSGEVLAIKVQYPGVRDSIDSDINNVAGLLRLTGLLPTSLDFDPIIEAGRVQLHQEADYVREAEHMTRFGKLLSGDENFEVPTYFPDLSTDKILTMSYIDSTPIEEMAHAPQETRDRIVHVLMELLLAELFEFKLMQTDPNFANYRYNTEDDKLVLLDFGASREVSDTLSGDYLQLLQTVVTGTTEDSFNAAVKMGLWPPNIPDAPRAVMMEIAEIILAPLRRDELFDFGDSANALEVRQKAMGLAGDRDLWHVPPAETVFIQRKLGGIYMLATRLKARVNVYALMQKYTS